MNSISLVVTNWNGLKLLKKYFLFVLETTPEVSEIIFCDDASEDDSVAYISELQKKDQRLRIIKHHSNKGFICNSNHAVKTAKGELVILLNNDIKPYPDFIKPSLRHFSNPKVFGVGFAEKNHENYGHIYWHHGYLQHQPGISPNTHISGWLSGGSSIIRRDLFLKLGGFDPIYHPFYCEDLDLGFRAWKSGYRLLWEPKSVVEHRHESTISKFPRHFSDYVKERNRLLTVWRNINDPQLLFANYLTVVGRCLFGPNYLKIIFAAQRQIKKFPPPIFLPRLSDRQVLSLFK